MNNRQDARNAKRGALFDAQGAIDQQREDHAEPATTGLNADGGRITHKPTSRDQLGAKMSLCYLVYHTPT